MAVASLLPRLPLPGETINGKYRIVRKLGEGGMGVVYEAVHMRLRQQVAIKMLHPRVLCIADAVARFEREARAAGQMRNTNVARVIDVDMTPEGLPCMVMEFLDGQDLSAVLADRGALPIEEAVDFVLQTCAAMDEAHALGIIHRDLKPSNLFVCEANGRRVIKVLDFGISKITTETDERVTRTQNSFGTPLYMSPEQIRSTKHVDTRADIWALGVICYELIAGLPPFVGSTTAAAASIVTDEPPPLKGARKDLPEGLDETILKALAKKPAERYQDVREFAAALAPFARPSASRWSLSAISSRKLVVLDLPNRDSSGSIGTDKTLIATSETQPRPRGDSAGAGSPLVTGSPWTTGSGASSPGARSPLRRLMIGAGAGVVLAGMAALTWVGARTHGSTASARAAAALPPIAVEQPPATAPLPAPLPAAAAPAPPRAGASARRVTPLAPVQPAARAVVSARVVASPNAPSAPAPVKSAPVAAPMGGPAPVSTNPLHL